MAERKPVPRSIETELLHASRRRCCLCFFLEHDKKVRKGQVGHLNHDPGDNRLDNLVWLCLEHHDEYDSRTSQSKGFTTDEVRRYRDKLHARHTRKGKPFRNLSAQRVEDLDLHPLSPTSDYEAIRARFPGELGFTSQPWRFGLWQVADQPEYFAYKAGNRADGVCLIERIDLPDGRIVIACIQTAGNPGQSITNAVEELCFQVCEGFEIPTDRLVLLEHYDYDEPQEWNIVSFGQMPPHGPFADPTWERMTPVMWRGLRLKPKKRLTKWHGQFRSKLKKLFPWPT